MTNSFIIEMTTKSDSLNSNSILRLYKQNMMLNIMENKTLEEKRDKKIFVAK